MEKMLGYNGKKAVPFKFAKYDNMVSFANKMRKIKNGETNSRAAKTYLNERGGRDWAGATSEEFQERCAVGNVDLVARSTEIMSKMNVPELETRRKVKVNDVVGSVLNVHQAYAGNPMCMKRKRRVVSETAPVAIVIDVIASAGVDKDHMIRRGAAALALARQISVVRPVDIWAVYGGRGNCGTNVACAVKLPGRPIDLARAAFAICDPSFMRLGMHAIGADLVDADGYSGYWFDNDMKHQVKAFPKAFGEFLGYKSEDIVGVGGISLPKQNKFATEEKAIAWVNEYVEKHTK